MSKPIVASAIVSATAVIMTISIAAADPRNLTGLTQETQIIAQAEQPSTNRNRRPAPSAGTQIACTRTGCHPIPRGCRIEKEFGWDGLPTGFDLVVCPLR